MHTEPIDRLTAEDRFNITKYIELYGGASCAPLETTLRYWNKNKRRLFKAFGNQLEISCPIHVKKNFIDVTNDLTSIYKPIILHNPRDVADYMSESYTEHLRKYRHPFIVAVMDYMCDHSYCYQDIKHVVNLFRHTRLIDKHIAMKNERVYKFEGFKATVKDGMKTIRTIQKVLTAMGFDKMYLFQEWQSAINLTLTNLEVDTELVVSINPIDFMTMSDNDCNWRSCMSWINSGCYSAGTIEMMNSNMVAVAYLRHTRDFVIDLDDDAKLRLPNKSWRALCYITKDIVLVGKNYPYVEDGIVKEVLKLITDTLKKTVHWTYQFHNQPYSDLIHFEHNGYLRWNFDQYRNPEHKSIIIYTVGMYNDLIEDTESVYYCCRNAVKKTKKLCASGPFTCMCCGDIIHNPQDIVSYEDIQSDTLCWDCRDNRTCEGCGKIEYDLPIKSQYGNFCSKECVQSQWFIPGQNLIISKSLFLDNVRETKYLFFYAKDKKEMRELENNILRNPIDLDMKLSHGAMKKLVKEHYNKDIDIFNQRMINCHLIPLWQYVGFQLDSDVRFVDYQNTSSAFSEYRCVIAAGKSAEEFKKRVEQIKNRVSLETII